MIVMDCMIAAGCRVSSEVYQGRSTMPWRACGQAQSSARDRGSSERRGSSTAGHWPSLVCHTHHPTATIATCAARWWHTECPSCSNSSITSTVTFTTGKAQQRQTQTRIDYSCAGANAPRLVTVIVTVLNVMRSIRLMYVKYNAKYWALMNILK